MTVRFVHGVGAGAWKQLVQPPARYPELPMSKYGPWCSGGESCEGFNVNFEVSGWKAVGCASVERGGWRIV